ncbi:MAG TPA: hypothetical protein VK615_17115 [Candidatus Binatia bacterium]|nr:hypothetical protein [Candidatus Binatia bacterium]
MADDYAHWFLKRRRLRLMDRERWVEWNAEWVAEEERCQPGFSQRLRGAALASLDGDDIETVRTALSALTAVGVADDIPRLEELSARGGEVAKDCGTAIYEIKHRVSGA